MHVHTTPYFNPEVECFVVLLLNVRRKIKGHVLVSTGLADQVLINPRETFGAAVIASAQRIILMHNHPSGDVGPSEADIRVTRELIRAGQVLRIEVLDHVIVGGNEHRSLRELGYFSNCYNNAAMESFWSTPKQELVYRGNFTSRSHAKSEIFDYFEIFYDRQRRHTSLRGLSPTQFGLKKLTNYPLFSVRFIEAGPRCSIT